MKTQIGDLFIDLKNRKTYEFATCPSKFDERNKRTKKSVKEKTIYEIYKIKC